MPGSITIALDAMGGDHAPEIVIRGADIALERHPNTRFLVFGAESQVTPLLAQLPRVAKVATVHHTSEIVQNDDKPSQALRAGRNTSMRLAIEAVADGRADGVVSAGNTGALMAIAKFVLKTLPGIDRPAIATFFPTLRGETVMLDLGANIECDAENLVQFALMGDAFARSVLGVTEPTVGLLNVGSEDLKGNDAVRGAAARLRGGLTPICFHGFVEGDDIGAGTVDVIVTDGFTGNVALKTAEGTAKLFAEALRTSFSYSPMAKIGYLFARGALKKFRDRFDPRRYNGAMFLGLRGIAVKSHGSTDAFGFANAIGVAIDMKLNGFLEKIMADLARVNEAMPARIVTNDELARQLDTSDDWIRQRTGIGERRIAAKGELTSDLATAAARRALQRAGMSGSDLDLIVLATATPDHTFPATATKVQAQLGMTRGAAFDVQAVCSGFIFALATADNAIRLGQARTALVIGAETFSRILDWEDRGTCVLFGDGAGALVLTAAPVHSAADRGILSTHLHSDGRLYDILYVDGGPSSTGTTGHLRMEGREVFRQAVDHLSEAVEEALAANGLTGPDIDWLVPHQANLRIIDAIARRLRLRPGQTVVTIERHANTSAASIPLALDEAVADGRIQPGHLVLMEALGGGLTWGASLVRW